MILFRERRGWHFGRFDLSRMPRDHSLMLLETSNNHPSPLYFTYFNCKLLRTQSLSHTNLPQCKRTAMGTASLHEAVSRPRSASEREAQHGCDCTELCQSSPDKAKTSSHLLSSRGGSKSPQHSQPAGGPTCRTASMGCPPPRTPAAGSCCLIRAPGFSQDHRSCFATHTIPQHL